MVITADDAASVQEATDSRKLRTIDGGGAVIITIVSLGERGTDHVIALDVVRTLVRHHPACRSTV
jgi:UDP-N-acetyl-D-mannosaminuronic acid transferase (WecB/TagA/CpsF family)